VVQEEHRGKLAHVGGLLLLEPSHVDHLRVGVLLVFEVARTAAAVRHRDAGEPLVLLLKALKDAVVGHDFEVVLMGADAEVRRPLDGALGRRPVGNEHLGPFGLQP
jgi:hypothetical protein